MSAPMVPAVDEDVDGVGLTTATIVKPLLKRFVFYSESEKEE